MVIALTSTSIAVTWDDPPQPDQNGVITSYILNYTNLNRTESFSESGIVIRNFTVTGLEKYELYGFSVAAVTQPGIGPFSAPESTFTEQDSMLKRGLLSWNLLEREDNLLDQVGKLLQRF